MTNYTHEPPQGSTNHSFSATDLLFSGYNDPKQTLKLINKSQLNKIILKNNKCPDHLAINIYWDTFRSWHNPQKTYTEDGSIVHTKKLKTKGIYLDYQKLSNTHGVSTETIRKKIVKLEGLGLISRSFQHKETLTTKSFNRLIIYVWQQTPHFFNSYGIDRNEVKELIPQTNYKYISEKYNIAFKSTATVVEPFSNKEGVSNQLGDTKELINSFFNKKDRSIRSNFCKNFLVKKEEGRVVVKNNLTSAPLQLKAPALQLKDFYPLSQSDADHLQIKSGRDFSLNAMNEILLDMSKRVKDRWFKSKKGFLSYMTKVFAYEKRDACKINNEGFRIRSNKTTEEITIQKQEAFLSEIEYSLQVSPEWHLKKKLCSVLEREKAYNLLNAYKHSQRVGGVFKIHLTKHVNLTERDKDIILNQVKATYESVDLATEKFLLIEDLEVVMPEIVLNVREKCPLTTKGEEDNPEIISINTGTLGLWGKISEELILYYGEALYRSWFSKITPEIDENKKTIKLIAPTEFIKSWINSNYTSIIEKISRNYEYSYMT